MFSSLTRTISEKTAFAFGAISQTVIANAQPRTRSNAGSTGG